LQVLKHPSEIHVNAETWIEQLVAGSIPVVLGFRHYIYEPPTRFGEELIHGPFSRFIYIHEFTERNGETIISDTLDVEWPWQYGGSFVMRQIIAPQIRLMFAKRSTSMVRLWKNGVVERWVAEKTFTNAS
jgi:ligand-binding SRPBCC domain-containing protein